MKTRKTVNLKRPRVVAVQRYCSASSLANRITEELMTMNPDIPQAVTVERIALMKLQPDGTEKNLGGRSYFVVNQAILKHLKSAGL
jgi:hypothetical protein